MDRKFLIGAVAVLVVFTGILISKPVVVQPANVVVQPAEVRVVNEGLGAMPGNSLNGPVFAVGGVETYNYSGSFKNTATSSLCSFKSPTATSTLSRAAVSITENTGGTIAYIARAANSWATTTNLATHTGSASRAIDMIATTTAQTLFATDGLVAPNSWINIQIEAMTNATGTCSVIFTK